MLIAILLWVVIVFFGLIFVGLLFDGSITGITGATMGVSLLIIFLCVRGLDRNEASQVCDAINGVGGQAYFSSGKCVIRNDGGFPVNTESDRYVYLNQQ